MKKNLLVLWLCLLCSLSAMAASRTRQQALDLAVECARNRGISLNSNTLRRNAMSKQTTDNAPYYVFNHGEMEGWTIISGDDRVSDVLAYSDEGQFVWEELPEVVQEMLQGFEKYVGTLDNNPQADRREVQRRAAAKTNPIGPLCVTKWDQYMPYHNLTPLSGKSRTATCCVATAFAQILYYHHYTQQHQASSTFDSSIPAYTLDAQYSSYKAGSAVTGPRTYHWDKMLPDYSSVNYTDEQAEAIATLMRDCGSALEVKYAVSVSITNSRFCSERAAKHFGLATTGVSYQGIGSVTAWHNAIDGELNAYRPVHVAGGAHAFVCDGRDANSMYHFNFGYSGRGDGFYSFDALNGYTNSMYVTTGLRLAGETTYTTKERLKIAYNSAVAKAALEPVGTIAGQYKEENYNALQALLETANTALSNNCEGMEESEITSLTEQIALAEQKLTERRVPYPSGIYYIKTYYKYPTGTKTMYANGQNIMWGNQNTESDAHRWQIDYDETANAYMIQNVSTQTYFNTIAGSTQAKLGSDASVRVEIWPTNLIPGTTDYNVSIRPIINGYRDKNLFFCNQGSNADGAGTSGSVVGWEPYQDYSMWVMEAIEILPMPTSSLAEDSVTLHVGETFKNTLTTNSTGRVRWATSNNAIARIALDGKITAVAVGEAVITATIGKTDEFSAQRISYKVKVVEGEPDAITDVDADNAATPLKTLRNGQVVILRGKEEFSVMGTKLN